MRIVIKCGGHGDINLDAVAQDVAALLEDGHQVALVHGGSGAIDALTQQLGVEPRRLVAPDGTTTRYTDAATMRAVQLGLLGEVKPLLVIALARHHVAALSLSGLDAGLVRAHHKQTVRAMVDGRLILIRDNLAGKIDSIDASVIERLWAGKLTPVLSPPALSRQGYAVNVDADRLAGALAAALIADHLILLTSAPGVLNDPHDPTSLLDVLQVSSTVDTTPHGGHIFGGMRLKLVAAREALAGGALRVQISDGRTVQPVRRALCGWGTHVELGAPTPAPSESSR